MNSKRIGILVGQLVAEMCTDKEFQSGYQEGLEKCQTEQQVEQDKLNDLAIVEVLQSGGMNKIRAIRKCREIYPYMDLPRAKLHVEMLMGLHKISSR